MNVAIMQPCYLPWRGYFALVRSADVFVHLDDVALPRGRSPVTRAKVKGANGACWLSVPVRRERGVTIAEARIDGASWRRKHAATLAQEYPASSPIVADLYARPWSRLADLNIALAERLAAALDLAPRMLRSRDLGMSSTGSARILELCGRLGATRYLTGHGAAHYLDHESFDRAGIDVLYLDYDLGGYPQPGGAFDPFVGAIDVLERADDPRRCTDAALVPWREWTARAATAPRSEKEARC